MRFTDQWPQLPVAAVETVTLHYLLGKIDIELNLSIEILQKRQRGKKAGA
ncbi:MAG: hypothetical protein H0X02_00610 [Nitrosomonas sp.]|nr:hypothetical protein [Nitrosomonas sp.]